jgi:hypothetical protein
MAGGSCSHESKHCLLAIQCCLLFMFSLKLLFAGHCNSTLTYSTVDATRARLAAALSGAGGTFTGSGAHTTTGDAV